MACIAATTAYVEAACVRVTERPPDSPIPTADGAPRLRSVGNERYVRAVGDPRRGDDPGVVDQHGDRAELPLDQFDRPATAMNKSARLRVQHGCRLVGHERSGSGLPRGR